MATATEYLRPDVISQVENLELRARFIVQGFLSGLNQSPYHGFSAEFSEHRKYERGDDLRTIDWNVFAKTDRYYIKKFQAETNLDTFLLVDTSASMDYGTEGYMTKFDYAICIAAALGYMSLSQQDAVGLAIFDDKLRAFLPPKSKRTHLFNILSHLANTRPKGETNLAESLHAIAGRVKKRGLMIVLSDLLADQEPVIEALHHLRFRGHDLIVMQVLDVSEATFPFQGQVRFEDAESADRLDVDPVSIRAGYLESLRKFIGVYRHECLLMQADFTTVDTSMTFDKALLEFLIQRQSRF
ncbi:MAG: hypothetical protein BIFFINMI_02882 [Phycisphaerae bacterium]|nr:hypothetical protein [Phycisphaerae bacterium]